MSASCSVLCCVLRQTARQHCCLHCFLDINALTGTIQTIAFCLGCLPWQVIFASLAHACKSFIEICNALQLAAGSIAVGQDGSVRSKADVAHVAGALIRSALPMNYHITVNGDRI